PTDNASSIIKISGSILTEIANPSLDFIPLEYDLTGWSMNSPSSENSIISGSNSLISCLLNPNIKHFNSIFSRPLKLLSNPAATAIKETYPRVLTSPLVSGTIPAIMLDNVDLPEPFVPINPTTSPSYAEKSTLSNA